jgi:TolB-like protein
MKRLDKLKLQGSRGAMKKLLPMAFGAGLMLLTVSLAQAESQWISGALYSHNMKPEYLYSTGQVEEKAPADKRIWDYLSFFTFKNDEDNGHLFRAQEATELKGRVRELGRQLMANAQESIADEYVVTINSFVNLNNLYKTSSLGRYIAEELIGELQMAGVEVIDVRKAAGLMIYEKHGEYGLSRDMNELSYAHASQLMVVGTYTHAQGQIFLNARLLQNSDGTVLSNASIVFDLDQVTRQMLSDESMPARRGRVVRVEQYKN